jgi:hypothetical protein
MITLQELQAELYTLALAHPPETLVKVEVSSHCVLADINSISTQSSDNGITINLGAE